MYRYSAFSLNLSHAVIPKHQVRSEHAPGRLYLPHLIQVLYISYDKLRRLLQMIEYIRQHVRNAAEHQALALKQFAENLEMRQQCLIPTAPDFLRNNQKHPLPFA